MPAPLVFYGKAAPILEIFAIYRLGIYVRIMK